MNENRRLLAVGSRMVLVTKGASPPPENDAGLLLNGAEGLFDVECFVHAPIVTRLGTEGAPVARLVCKTTGVRSKGTLERGSTLGTGVWGVVPHHRSGAGGAIAGESLGRDPDPGVSDRLTCGTRPEAADG